MANQKTTFGRKKLVDTTTAVPAAGADNHISIAGSAAQWRSITQESFLPEPKPAQDQVLIRTGQQSSKVAAGQRLSEVQQNEKLTVHGSREIKVLQSIDESAGQNIEITAGMTLTLKGPGGTIKIDPSGITIQGILVKINC